MSSPPPPVDHAARERARRELGTSFVLEAGAGTGKTTLLVDRIESLVLSGTASLDRIAAVTFTENAATTMKLRLRERLERARGDAARSAAERERAAQALDVLERAPISTIHALCAAMLEERPLECGVVPGFRVADETEADMLFAEAWEEWLTERLLGGDEILVDALDAGIALEGESFFAERSSLRGLARRLIEQRDLVPLVADETADPTLWREELLSRARRGIELAQQAKEGDTLAARLLLLGQFAEATRFLEGRALAQHLLRLEPIQRNFGHKPRWPTPEALAEARDIAAWTKTAREAWAAAEGERLHGRLVRALATVTASYQRKKAARGVLDFLDLLLLARDALRDRESVRRYFRARFAALIIDEFQDTDPLQVEIAEALGGGVPGDLVVVGDAKQSIYRFRRAEVSLFERISARAASTPGHAVLQLTQNFRSRPALLRFVNRVFAALIQPSVEAEQTRYEAIEPPPGLPEEPSVLALRFEAPLAEGDELLRAEAAALATLLAEVARGRFDVRDPETKLLRPSRAGDVMVLARRLTQVRALEEALEGAGLRFTVEGGKSFFDRQEVHETLAVLRALDDPSDRVALVSALRSSFFGVSDRDIVSYALLGGTLSLDVPVDPGKAGAESLEPALLLLARLNRDRTRISVGALLETLYDETRVLAALTGTRRGASRVSNLEKVTTLARQAGSLGVLTVRGFVRLLEERIASAREEPDLPTTRPGDPHTIRILSIHKAKGLEAPIVALYDSADEMKPRAETIPLWDEGKIAVGFRAGCQPPRWEALKTREEARAWAESRRLLYVACTRARDYLILPAPPADARVGNFWKDLTAFLPRESDADVRIIDASELPAPHADEARADLRLLSSATGGDAIAALWEKQREEVLAEGSYRAQRPISASRAAARTAAPPVVGLGGAGGRSFGSLVHRLLEWVPLDGAGRALATAEALAPSFGVDAAGARRAAEAVERALALPVMERARRSPRVFRELPLVFGDGEDLIEGVIDLVFEEDGQLVIVDYKTDQIAPGQAIDQAHHHAPQLQLYGRGLAQATGQSVKERLVLFTTLGETVPV